MCKLTNDMFGQSDSPAPYPAAAAPTFEKANLLVLPAMLLKKCGGTTIPMVEESTLQHQLQVLSRARNMWLPLLLSGQIDVEAIAL